MCDKKLTVKEYDGKMLQQAIWEEIDPNLAIKRIEKEHEKELRKLTIWISAIISFLLLLIMCS